MSVYRPFLKKFKYLFCSEVEKCPGIAAPEVEICEKNGFVAVLNKHRACAVVSPPKVSVIKPVFPAHIHITVVCTLSSFTPNKPSTPNCLCCTCTYGTYRVVTLVTQRLRDVKLFTAGADTPASSSSHLGGKNMQPPFQPSSSLSWQP